MTEITNDVRLVHEAGLEPASREALEPKAGRRSQSTGEQANRATESPGSARFHTAGAMAGAIERLRRAVAEDRDVVRPIWVAANDVLAAWDRGAA